jgi:kynureninase
MNLVLILLYYIDFFPAPVIKVRSGGLASSNQGAGTGQCISGLASSNQGAGTGQCIIFPKNIPHCDVLSGIFMVFDEIALVYLSTVPYHTGAVLNFIHIF